MVSPYLCFWQRKVQGELPSEAEVVMAGARGAKDVVG